MSPFEGWTTTGTVQSPQRWADSPAWKQDYCNVGKVSAQDLARLRGEAEQARITARGIRQSEFANEHPQ